MIETARKTFPNFSRRRDDPPPRQDGDGQRLERDLPTPPTGRLFRVAEAARASRSSTASALRRLVRVGARCTASSRRKGPEWAVDCGAAHGALAMTTPGDTSMATLSEVEKAMKGGGARVDR